MKQVRNVFIIFVVSGFGCELTTYLAWGFINALYFLPLLLLNKIVPNIEMVIAMEFASAKEVFHIFITYWHV
jgi:hypothetical protein